MTYLQPFQFLKRLILESRRSFEARRYACMCNVWTCCCHIWTFYVTFELPMSYLHCLCSYLNHLCRNSYSYVHIWLLDVTLMSSMSQMNFVYVTLRALVSHLNWLFLFSHLIGKRCITRLWNFFWLQNVKNKK